MKSLLIDLVLFHKTKSPLANSLALWKILYYKMLSVLLGTESIKWNFTKFLVDRSGKVVEPYGSSTKPKKIKKDIEKLLK